MNILSRFQRYTLKSPSIILSSNVPPAPAKMVADTEGEYILVDQLLGAIRSGGLLINDKWMQEHIADGDAQKALVRDLTILGYDDFDQVMEILKEVRDLRVKEREFEVWCEGYRATGEDQKAHLIGKATARSFHDAVLILQKEQHRQWQYDEKEGTWSTYSCKFYDNEKDARRFNG